MIETQLVGDLADGQIGGGDLFLCLFDHLILDMLLCIATGQVF